MLRPPILEPNFNLFKFIEENKDHKQIETSNFIFSISNEFNFNDDLSVLIGFARIYIKKKMNSAEGASFFLEGGGGFRNGARL